MRDFIQVDFSKREHFINRELSWLEFNQRVLDQAFDASNPLLERLKFMISVYVPEQSSRLINEIARVCPLT